VIQVAPQMRVLPVDLRKGIDGLAQLCREKLGADPFSGYLFIFRGRRATAIKLLAFDGQGFWVAQKRLSKGRNVFDEGPEISPLPTILHPALL
jgi:transposase